MDGFKNNATIWENIYQSGQGNLVYPNDILIRVAHRLLAKSNGKDILDYGFGSGANLIHFLKRGFNVSGVEVSNSAIDLVATKLQAENLHSNLKSLIEGKIPYEDNSFDCVIAWQVLYYNDWEGLNIAVNEINRVLKPGGIFIGTMGAIGDCSHINSNSLGDYLYQSKIPGQEGAVVIILDREHLQRCFPNKNLTIGEFNYQYEDMEGRHWIITYEN